MEIGSREGDAPLQPMDVDATDDVSEPLETSNFDTDEPENETEFCESFKTPPAKNNSAKQTPLVPMQGKGVYQAVGDRECLDEQSEYHDLLSKDHVPPGMCFITKPPLFH